MKLSPGRIASVKAAPPFRDVTFDIVRGLAIFIMIGANMGPVLEMPHSFAFRVYGSIPAPIFILIAGMWVGMARLRNASNYDMKYYLQRGAFLIAVGAFVDMAAWRIIPFMTVDVLYSIGLSLPIVYLVSRFPSYVVVVLIACIFCATPMLQFVFGYIRYPLEHWLVSGRQVMPLDFETSVLQHYFIDGWFPLFPWLGVALSGILLARYRWERRYEISAFGKEMIALAMMLILIGGTYWYYLPGPMYERKGFTELFYPPTLGIILFSLGYTLLLLIIADSTKHAIIWQPLRCLGEAPLFMYIVHLLIIGQIFVRFMDDMQATEYLFVYGVFALWLIIIGAIIRLVKREIQSARKLIRWIFGGGVV